MIKGFDLELLNANKEKHPDVFDAVYSACVEEEVEKKYTPKKEISLLRQQNRKPVEYARYDAYVEECKRKVKAAFGMEVTNEDNAV